MSTQYFQDYNQSHQNAPRSPGTTFHAPLTHSIPRLKPHNAASCCSCCGITFRMFRQKYNCYNCGNVTCGRCSDNRAELPKFSYFEPVRVCNLCYDYLKIMEMNRSQLIRSPTKILREYISAYNLPCHNIIEKDDLINIIMAHRPLEERYEVYYRDHYPIAQSVQTSHETASDIPPSANYTRTGTQYNATPISLKTIIREKVDISKLSVKTIKEILRENCIDYSKMVEKSELIERMESLIKWEKHEMSRNANELSDDGLCRICCDAESNCLLMDCGKIETLDISVLDT
ncbi:4548_t:CDS:2, partial [Funneliformis caledonium]